MTTRGTEALCFFVNLPSLFRSMQWCPSECEVGGLPGRSPGQRCRPLWVLLCCRTRIAGHCPLPTLEFEPSMRPVAAHPKTVRAANNKAAIRSVLALGRRRGIEEQQRRGRPRLGSLILTKNNPCPPFVLYRPGVWPHSNPRIKTDDGTRLKVPRWSQIGNPVIGEGTTFRPDSPPSRKGKTLTADDMLLPYLLNIEYMH